MHARRSTVLCVASTPLCQYPTVVIRASSPCDWTRDIYPCEREVASQNPLSFSLLDAKVLRKGQRKSASVNTCMYVQFIGNRRNGIHGRRFYERVDSSSQEDVSSQSRARIGIMRGSLQTLRGQSVTTHHPPLELEDGAQGTFLETTFEWKSERWAYRIKNENRAGEEPKVWRYKQLFEATAYEVTSYNRNSSFHFQYSYRS